MKDFNKYVSLYKEALGEVYIQKAYAGLFKYMFTLKAHMLKSSLSDKFSFGNISPGYLDFTYFPFFSEEMRKCKLRFGIVLNHKEMRFELWLMGQNAEIQRKYWDLLKSTKWNEGKTVMPKYSVLEAVLVDNPDFNNLSNLTGIIEEEVTKQALLILEYINNHTK